MSSKHKEMAEWYRRAQEEILDSMDEELEMELDDDRLSPDGDSQSQIPRNVYFKELFRLQGELVKLQDWVVANKMKVAVLFEGRDSAGKGGAIKRITQRLNPRVCKVVALPAPNEREKTQWYFQRYISQLPAGGEIALFDRSWYNRAGVEKVMGFCTKKEYEEFLRTVPDLEQYNRFMMRIHDPLKQWKLSPMDLEARRLWEAYTKAKETMLERTHIPEAPWWVVAANDKKKARLNCITHLLTQIPYKEVDHPTITLPARVHNPDYLRGQVPQKMYVPEVY